MTERVQSPTAPDDAGVSRALPRASEARTSSPLGGLPLLAATAALGLLLVVVAYARSRSLTSSSQALFWIGLLVIYVPIVLRLALPAARRGERIGLVALLGLTLYLVKVLRDPFGFTFADELVHAPNADAILRTHHLFHANAILDATPYYPGLESVTAALSSLTGLGVFGSGLVVVGAARILIVLALFLLVERLASSARVAGIAVCVYAANSNFVFFSAQFSYESLALPLFVTVLFAYAEWRRAPSRDVWTGSIVVLTVAVVATHHITSYALVALLAIVSLGYLAWGRRDDSPRRFALFALVAATAWLVLVGSATIGYLSPVVTRAFRSIADTVSGESAPRQLFKSSSETTSGPPLIERVAAISSVLLLIAAYPFGLRRVWRTCRHDPLAIVLALAGGGVFATYALRFAPDAWETANRSSEFLFLGLALVVPLVRLDRWTPKSLSWLGPLLLTAGLAVVFAGGVIAGWPPALRLSQPYRIEAGGRTIDAEGRSMAGWADRVLGPGRRYAASDADARLLNTYAAGFAMAGQSPDVEDILRTPRLDRWQLPLLRENGLRFVVVDRRHRSFDNTGGYFFGFRAGSERADALYDPKVARKFDHRFDRVFDSGDIVIFDVGRR
jgi:hypothetical protein